MLSLSYDLHIHSCLSPCSDDEMTPANIAGMAYIKGLDVIAVTDHNSSRNCEATVIAGQQYGLTVLPGMELTTEEEVHVACLFPTVALADEWSGFVYDHLMKVQNQPVFFGRQVLMDSEDNILGEEPYLLINAVSIGFEEVFPLVKKRGGVAFPAHIDKSSNSLISNLGFVPPDSIFKCVEYKKPDTRELLCEKFPYLTKCRALTNSDAHSLHNISEPVNFLHCDSKSPVDILAALEKETYK